MIRFTRFAFTRVQPTFVGTPDSVFVVDDTDQVVNAVDAVVASGKKLAVRSGGHCVEGFVDDPAVQCVIDLGQMDSVYYDRHRRAFAVEAGRRSVVCTKRWI